MSFEADEEGELDCRYSDFADPNDLREITIAIGGTSPSLCCCWRNNLQQRKPVVALYLHGCEITTDGAEVLAQFLQSTEAWALTHLSLSENTNIRDAGVEILTKALMKNTKMQYLSLRSTGLTSEAGVHIAKMLESPTALIEISLEDNALKDRGLLPIASAMLVNTTLTKFNAVQCQLTDLSAECIQMLMHGNSTLQTLYLGRNPSITATGCEALLTAVLNGCALTSLTIPTKPVSKIPTELRKVISVDD